MAKEDALEFDAEVLLSLSNGMFRIKLQNEHVAIAHVSGRLRKNKIKILPGDSVKVEFSPYDFNRGRITYRNK